MVIQHSLQRIVVVPRNGYVNRLQAWASAAILGGELGVPVEVLWEPESVAPATSSQLFGTQLEATFIDADALRRITPTPHADFPRHLTVDSTQRLVVLAGHDLGEQHFMAEMPAALASECRPTVLVVIAGGKFVMGDANTFEEKRREFYDGITWHPVISDAVSEAIKGRSAFSGLHIRQTDRSREAPTPRAIRSALRRLHEMNGTQSLFVAADSSEARSLWMEEARRIGFSPWSTNSTDYDRSRDVAGQDAIIDWLLIGKAQTLIYSASSSFGEEAAVLTGNFEGRQALTASAPLQVIRDARRLGNTVVQYPRRAMEQRSPLGDIQKR